ncbi:RNA polymerase sigma factor [Kribbella sp. CA-293567]|uniref:RNA polymerase sigma factor n=1 Tax=Kribbella sp. CA-293567 TaxID=3002436 RepID=UPI0022DE4918|nr:sigma-70 family RNA polymerase sigma factor [Kribbella sp. CA-293567]WBQ07629.1 sigma-70 family RNA polymerase sigma factor [Kribbella sp. CA-293567]
MAESVPDDLLRELAPQVLGALVRRYGHFDTAEDAVQEALLAATRQWPGQGRPDDPRAWLIRVASRRLTDLLRNEQARQRRENTVAQWTLPEDRLVPPVDNSVPVADDTLILLFLCCHPSLSAASQIALTLRAVGGLTTAEIARAFLVPEATMTRRITRAKQRVRDAGARFSLPPDRAERLDAVLKVIYLIFNEGYASTAGPTLQRVELAAEAIRLARLVHALLPDDAEVAGLLALLLLTDARRPARSGPSGELIPMADQDRSLWLGAAIAEGVALVTDALPRGPVGPYQLQAAIAAVHDESPSWEETDWPQIVALYEVLLQLTDNPMVSLNHVVAMAMAHGPQQGLKLLADIEDDERLTRDHRLHAVRAHLLEQSGDATGARTAYELAATLTTSVPQQRYLNAKAAGTRTSPG